MRKSRYLLVLVISLIVSNLALAGGGKVHLESIVNCHAGQCTGVPDGWAAQSTGGKIPDGEFHFWIVELKPDVTHPERGHALVRYSNPFTGGKVQLVSPNSAIAVDDTVRANQYYELDPDGKIYQCTGLMLPDPDAAFCWMYA